VTAFRIGPFELTERLGRGGMGSVWAGMHMARRVPVAMKVLHARFAQDTWFRSSFAGEVRAVARLDHPNIVTILDHGVVGVDDARTFPADQPEMGAGSAWLAMERLPGVPLTRFKGRATWEQLLPWLRDLLAGLGHAHARGLLHRDLKPANVLVHGERAVLVDFGLARELDGEPDETHDGLVVGTSAYMAPEQFEAHDASYGPWTDLYELGCMVWALLTGQAPYGQRRPHLELHHAHANTPLPVLRPRMWTPPGLEAWLRRLLEKDPLDRYRFAADARLGLDAVAVGDVPAAGRTVPMVVQVPPMPERWPARIRRRDRAPELIGAGLRLFGLRRPPIVGRDPTRELLWEALRTVHSGEARAVLLQGPAGAGKSRIVGWLAEAAHGTGTATVISARHGEEPGRGDGLLPAICRALGLVGGAAELAAGRLDALARRWSLSKTVLADLEAILLPRHSPRRAPVGVRRNSLLIALLEHMGKERPVALCLDDVHWGPDSLAFVAQLLDRPPALRPRVLVLMTARPVPAGTTTGALFDRILAARGTERVSVGLLPPGWRTALIQSLIPVEADLARRLETRAGGNPLFTVQLLGDWVERGLLVPGPDGLTLRPGSDAEMPANLHDVWQRRLARALVRRSPGERQSIELAAILGTYIDQQEWEDACLIGGLMPSGGLVDDLLAAGLAQPDPLGLEHGWGFVHGMLRESLLRSAEEEGRAVRWHEACAAMLARRVHKNPRAALRLGHHRVALGDPAGAVEPLGTGAWAAVRDSEYLLAERGLDDRAAALDALNAPPADLRRGQGWLMRARVARRRGDLERAQDATRALLSASRDPSVQRGQGSGAWTDLASQAHREAGRLAQLQGQPAAAMDHARVALSLAQQRGDSEALAWCRRDYGLLRVRAGARLSEVDGILAGAQATFEQVGETFGAADCIRARALVRHRELRPGDAEPLLRAARRALRRCLAVQEPAHTRVGLGDVARMAGRSAEAVRWYRAARERFQHIGHPGPIRLPWWEAAVRLDRRDGRGAREAIDGRPHDLLDFARVIEARVCLAEGNPEGARALLDFRSRGPDPEVAEQAEKLAREAMGVGATDLGRKAARVAITTWGALGWPARARRVGRWVGGT